jgi:hypothetical protein
MGVSKMKKLLAVLVLMLGVSSGAQAFWFGGFGFSFGFNSGYWGGWDNYYQPYYSGYYYPNYYRSYYPYYGPTTIVPTTPEVPET